MLSPACAYGKPLRSGGRHLSDTGRWSCRACGSLGADRALCGSAAYHHAGADKAFDAEDFVNELRAMKVIPHVAQNTNGRRSAIDGRITRHAGYAVSRRNRKRIEETFAWIKTVTGQDRTRFRGVERAELAFTFGAAA